jgi:hypothetical protein
VVERSKQSSHLARIFVESFVVVQNQVHQRKDMLVEQLQVVGDTVH